jgi:hypothetical protein
MTTGATGLTHIPRGGGGTTFGNAATVINSTANVMIKPNLGHRRIALYFVCGSPYSGNIFNKANIVTCLSRLCLCNMPYINQLSNALHNMRFHYDDMVSALCSARVSVSCY